MGDFSAAQSVVKQAVDSGLVPGAVAFAGRESDVLFRYTAGQAQIYGTSRLMHRDTVFDLASLTKVVATLPAVLILAQQGDLNLQAPVSKFFDAFGEGSKAQVRVSQLLTHTAGLVSHQPFYETAHTRQDVLNLVLAEPLAYEPGAQVVYSDLGFIILGALVEKITGTELSVFVHDEIFKPLGMNHTGYTPDVSAEEDIASTEVVNGTAKTGVVHDENAEAMGGIAGHAGLFAPAKDLAKYLGMWASDDSGPLSRTAREKAVELQTGSLGGRRGWGWVLPGDPQSVAGDLWPKTGVSHTGFTGTSLVFDRPTGNWAILLTNRVHLGRQTNIGDFRRRFHNAAAWALFH